MDDSEHLGNFVPAAREYLGNIEIQLLQMQAMGPDLDDNLVNTVFLAIQSVNEAAAFHSLKPIGALARRIGDVLATVRDNKLVINASNVGVMLEAVARLKTMIESIETCDEIDNSWLCEKLDEVAAADVLSTPVSLADALEPEKTVPKPTHRSGSAAQPKTPAPKGVWTSNNEPNNKAPSDPAANSTKDSSLAERVGDVFDAIEDGLNEVQNPPATSPPRPAPPQEDEAS